MRNETDFAWAAGIIDGEGTIIMTRAKPGINRRITMSFQIRISVRMTHRATIRRLWRLFGGTFKLSKARQPQHRDAFEWYVGDLLTVEVLGKVLPYLLTKKRQASLVLEYREKCSGGTKPGGACSTQQESLRVAYFDRLRKLNKKGKNVDREFREHRKALRQQVFAANP